MTPLPPLSRHLENELRRKIDGKAKPPGSLGRIEELAIQIGLVTQSLTPDLGRAAIIIFAGDHGIVEEGVTAFPAIVSTAVARSVLAGKAGANIAARSVGADVFLVNAGLLGELAPHPALLDRHIRAGTRNFRREPAMTAAELSLALDTGASLVRDLKARGFGLLALGEIGIGNTSSAAALLHIITGIDLSVLVGPGAGVPTLGLHHKRDVVQKSLARSPVMREDALLNFGGFEIAMMAGAMAEGAACGVPILVDGFVGTAAACAAITRHPHLKDYLIFAHLSAEPGHTAALQWLGVKPLLDLGMRLGEGTGAALAIPLVRMAEAMLRDMADLRDVSLNAEDLLA